ncbi:DUF2334 domain-containing protein [Candidatus Kaiserbacteria bacterium]|nr:DUF2334 domain-containing protein [Candidatus Kaiserbacteria bacterium]
MANQESRHTPIYIVIFIIVLGLAYYFLGDLVLPEDYNQVIVNDSEVSEADCKPFPITVGDKTVILRVDDIQAYTWKDVSIKMIEDAKWRQIPLTLGVIPKDILSDVELVNFIKVRICNHELAMHGFDHGVTEAGGPEFGELEKDEALDRIERGLDILNKISTEPIVTWIPPQNIQSSGTDEALKEKGIQKTSKEGKGEWDYDATTFNYADDVLVEAADTISACEETFKTESVCIIMLHPQNYADGLDFDEELYKTHYLALLDGLIDKGYSFARFKDFE